MDASGSFLARLPGGFQTDENVYREVELRPLTGRDEEALRALGSAPLMAEWTTELLTRSLVRIGPREAPSRAEVRSLTVGDREALLLHLRRRMFGEHLSCVIECPACEEKMDLDLNVGDLLLPVYEHAPGEIERQVSAGERELTTRFRLPTGADQEAVATRAESDPEEAAARLLERCVTGVTDVDGQPVPAGEWPSQLLETVAEEMEKLDPQAELRLSLSCPACEHSFSSLLDAAAYLAEELDQRIRHLYREVHVLAFYYGWAETDILALPSPKRRRYIDILNEALSAR